MSERQKKTEDVPAAESDEDEPERPEPSPEEVKRRRRQRLFKALLEAKGQLISTPEDTVH
ncbi:MAG: hypothetical protein ACJ754_01760 [Pyrinomonadaceae bacterium]